MPFLNQYYATSGNVPRPEILRNIVQGELDAAYENRARQRMLNLQQQELDAKKELWRQQQEAMKSAEDTAMVGNIMNILTNALGTYDKWKDSPIGKGLDKIAGYIGEGANYLGDAAKSGYGYISDIIGRGYNALTGNKDTMPEMPNISPFGINTLNDVVKDYYGAINKRFTDLPSGLSDYNNLSQRANGMQAAQIIMANRKPTGNVRNGYVASVMDAQAIEPVGMPERSKLLYQPPRNAELGSNATGRNLQENLIHKALRNKLMTEARTVNDYNNIIRKFAKLYPNYVQIIGYEPPQYQPNWTFSR